MSPKTAMDMAFFTTHRPDDFEAVACAVAPGDELNVIGRFRSNHESRWVYGELPADCGTNRHCLANAPDVFLIAAIRVGSVTLPVLVVGRARVESTLVPMADRLPRDEWRHAEPLRDVRWTGELPLPHGERLLFSAFVTGARPVSLTRTQRHAVADLISSRLLQVVGEWTHGIDQGPDPESECTEPLDRG